MGAAPLSWLAKIGGDTLKTKAKLLSSAVNELYDYGQCKIVAVVDNTADNGKTVLITTDDNKTYSGTIANKKCEFLLPPKTLYTVQKVSSGSAEFTTKVEAGYGDCILVHLDTEHVEVKQGDIVGLDYIKAATADDLKNKVPEANAVKSCFQSVSNGKALVASAITDKGVNTDATATFEVMANNIKSIQTSITPTAKHSNGTSSSSVSLTAGTYIVFCGGAAGCCQNYGGNSYPGSNWVYSVAVSISGGSYSTLTDSGHNYNNGCGLRTLTYLVVVPSSCTVTTSVSVGGAYQDDTAPRSSTIAVKIK